jgi:hypothetical protein
MWNVLNIILKGIFGIFRAIYIVSKASVVQYIEFVNKIVTNRKIFFTKMMAWTLILFVPIAALLAPVGFVVIIASMLIVVDQITYPTNVVSKEFNVAENHLLSVDEKGALLFAASHAQMDKELKSVFGWCPNDLPLLPTALLDNRCNRQLGVHYATREMVTVLSGRITKFGLGDEENRLTMEARQKMSYGPDEWGWYSMSNSEKYFKAASKLLNEFEIQSRQSAATEFVNIRTDDLVAIMELIKDDVLGEPYGRLTARNSKVKWSDLDDVVYYAQGAAIVARDMLVTLRSTYHDELMKGGMDNMNAAIDSLNAVVTFNPYWVMRGDGDSLFADHRSKISRYYSEAFRRIEDLVQSVKM